MREAGLVLVFAGGGCARDFGPFLRGSGGFGGGGLLRIGGRWRHDTG